MMTIALEQELTHLMETCMNNNDGDKRANGRSNAAAMTLATTGQLDNNHSEQQIRFESHLELKLWVKASFWVKQISSFLLLLPCFFVFYTVLPTVHALDLKYKYKYCCQTVGLIGSCF